MQYVRPAVCQILWEYGQEAVDWPVLLTVADQEATPPVSVSLRLLFYCYHWGRDLFPATGLLAFPPEVCPHLKK
jgi:hypothetical protein